MNITSSQLLRMLGSGVRAAGGAPAATAGGTSGQTAAASFASLLQQARDGSLTSASPVSVGSDCDVSCSEDQMARLSLGADKLEAAGVHTALVNIDGQQLVLDVHARQVTGRASAANGLIAGIDGVLDLGDARSASAAGGSGAIAGLLGIGAGTAPGAGTTGAAPAPGGLAAGNQSLLKLLAQLQPG